ncbi:hypothetical protein MTO96_028300 [Rhipicephalus appendiculatus]
METFKDSKGRDVTKPSIVRDYNHTVGGVDKSDQMLSDYPVSRKRQKIYYKIFRHLIDEATFNSFVLYQKDGGKMSHLDYRLALIEAILTRLTASKEVTSYPSLKKMMGFILKLLRLLQQNVKVLSFKNTLQGIVGVGPSTRTCFFFLAITALLQAQML